MNTKHTGKLKSLILMLYILLHIHNKYTYNKSKKCSNETSVKRARFLENCIVFLYNSGFKLKNLESFRIKHVKFLLESWIEQGLAPATILTRLSWLRIFCVWLNKPGMMDNKEHLDLSQYEINRTYIATTDKSWSDEEIARVFTELTKDHPLITMQLMLQDAFGIRVQESMMIRPVDSDQGIELKIEHGAKGGRKRFVPIDTEYKRFIVDKAKMFACGPNGSLIPVKYSLKQWRAHYYYVCRKHSITRKEGKTSHGLRAGFACRLYKLLTLIDPPVRGGDTSQITRELDKAARLEIAKHLGHAREGISNAYIGS